MGWWLIKINCQGDFEQREMLLQSGKIVICDSEPEKEIKIWIILVIGNALHSLQREKGFIKQNTQEMHKNSK